MKKNICMILCLVWSFIMIGCSNKDEGTAMNIYYLDPEGYGLVQDEYFRNAEEPEAAVEEVLAGKSQNHYESIHAKPATGQRRVVTTGGHFAYLWKFSRHWAMMRTASALP